LLAERGPLSRTQLGALAGLSKPTASQLVDRLEAAGLVEPALELAAEPDVLPGRTARRYRLRGAAAHVAGLDVTPARILARVCDLSGRTVGTGSLVTPGRSATGTVDRVRDALAAACDPAGISVGALHHVVIGLGGAVDPATGRLGFARHLPGWHEPDLLARLRTSLTSHAHPNPNGSANGNAEADTNGNGSANGSSSSNNAIANSTGSLHPRVDVENDVNLAAVAEQAVGVAADARDFVVLWIAEGIGAAVVIDGRLHRGATGGAGEVGYMPVPGAPLVRTIGRGTNGGFQALAGAPAVLKLARHHGFSGADAPTALSRAVAALHSGQPVLREAARRLLTELADRLATGLAPLVAVLDPELVVLTGAVPRAGGAPLRELTAEALHGMAIPRPRLVESAVPDNPVLAGAIHAGLTATREAVFSATFPAPNGTT
jgi:predicted NBD/HSP70 family sugar kinase